MRIFANGNAIEFSAEPSADEKINLGRILGIGLISPPVGGVLYIGSAISGIKVNKLIVTMLPIFVVMIIALLLFTYVPAFSLWLPRLLGYAV